MKFSKRLLACAVAASLAAPMSAFATTGYFSHGYGTKNKALGGGGSALPQDAMIAATNPAGMVWVGERMDLGAAIFSPSSRGYTVTGAPSGAPGTFGLEPGSFESDNDFFIIPHFAYNWMLDADSSVGLTIYGNGGMNTEYPSSLYLGGTPPGTFGAGTAGVDLSQLFITGTYARKIDDKSSWGVSLIAAYQRFKAEGLAGFSGFSSDSANLTNNGYDDSTGFGAKLGWQGEVSPGLTLAASYQTKMSMSKFDKYKGLFAEQGDFDIPSTWTLGLAYEVNATSTLTFDIQQIMYSDVASISNPLLPNLSTSQLGNSDGAGFGWEYITVYKIGYQWTGSNPDWTWRVGYSLNDQPIPDSEMLFNILAPGVMEQHLTGGFTWKTGADSEFNFAAMYAPETTVTGPNTLEAPGQQTIELNMTQWELEASWAWKF
jgi:long-chain fatty acid transport protein